MAYDIDSSNPGNTSLISQLPADERGSRVAIENCIAVEHDYTVGVGGEVRHKFGVGTEAARDSITDSHWVVGSLWLATDVVTGKTLLQVCTATGTPPTWVTTDIELLDANNQWTKGQIGEWFDLTEGANVASNWQLANSFTLDPTTDFTLDDPTLPDFGNEEFQSAVYVITQDSTGTPQVITFGSLFRGAYGTKPVLSTDADAVDVLYCTLLPTGHIAVSILQGLDLS